MRGSPHAAPTRATNAASEIMDCRRFLIVRFARLRDVRVVLKSVDWGEKKRECGESAGEGWFMVLLFFWVVGK